MAPSSGGNATGQSVRVKFVVGVDYGTAYSGMRKSAMPFLQAHGVPLAVVFGACKTSEVAIMKVSAFESLKMMAG